MTDYEQVNDMAWIKKVRQRGDGSAMLSQDPRRVIRRFANDGALKRNGSAVLLNQQKQLVARWFRIGWAAKDTAGHYGYLHIILRMADGGFDTWDIEDLREVERKGTSSVDADEWTYPDGTPYPDVWAVILDGKQMSPVRNRNQTRANYRPMIGSLGAFWVGTFGTGKLGKRSPTRRTDLLPFRYLPLTTPPGPPPGGAGYVAPNDVELADLIRRAPGLLK